MAECETLFRGKTKVIAGCPYNNGKPDGEWVNGYVYHDIGCYKIRQFDFDYARYVDYEVDPETVGQFIGILDKNEKKIFNGDIVKTKYGRICEVYWFASKLCWDLRPIECKSKAPDEYDLFKSENLEIVGNIYDNIQIIDNYKIYKYKEREIII